MDGQVLPIVRKELAAIPLNQAPQPRAVIQKPRGGLPVNMTAKRLILLLQIYEDGGRECRTWQGPDIQMLSRSGLVACTPNQIYTVTAAGDAYVKKLLAIEP